MKTKKVYRQQVKVFNEIRNNNTTFRKINSKEIEGKKARISESKRRSDCLFNSLRNK